jgi:hypothetical protein
MSPGISLEHVLFISDTLKCLCKYSAVREYDRSAETLLCFKMMIGNNCWDMFSDLEAI